MIDTLSARGARAAGTPLRIDYAAFQEAEADRYHPDENPDGKIALNVAENRLSWPDLRRKVEEVVSEGATPDWVPSYTSPLGAPEFREVAAGFLAHHLTGCPVDPEQLAVSAGATGVIETTSLILADEGDVAVIPAPCYPVYRQDMGNVPGVERFDLRTHREPAEIADGPVLAVDHLESALEEIEAEGKRFRMLVLTSPDNPTGGVYDVGFLREVADWCVERRIHLVVNEIYGLSLIDTTHPDIRSDYDRRTAFTSFANVMLEKESDYLHQWYSLSKDLGISGFRLGFVHSHNEAFLQAYENLNLPHSTSNHTQWLMGRVLKDREFMTRYVTENRARITVSYATSVRSLREMGLPYVPSRGSLFVWADFSELMDESSEEAELRLWDRMFREAGVLITPGIGFGHGRRGLFRIVHPCVPHSELRVALRRLKRFVEGVRG